VRTRLMRARAELRQAFEMRVRQEVGGRR